MTAPVRPHPMQRPASRSGLIEAVAGKAQARANWMIDHGPILSVSDIVVHGQSAVDDNLHAGHALLRQLVALADDELQLPVRCLFPCDTEQSALGRLLHQAEFSRATEVVRVERSIRSIGLSDHWINHLGTTAFDLNTEIAKPAELAELVARESAQLSELLADLLSELTDRLPIPGPTSDQLLDEWQLSDAALILVRHAGKIVAVAATVPQVGLLSRDASAPELMELRFLGVDPAHRRRRLASRLVARTLAQNPDVATFRSAAACFAWHDAHNVAAARLYLSCGFHETDRRELWYRPSRALSASP